MGQTKASNIRQVESNQVKSNKDKENLKTKNQKLTYKQPSLRENTKNAIAKASSKALVPIPLTKRDLNTS
jgi:hypothetical protein